MSSQHNSRPLTLRAQSQPDERIATRAAAAQPSTLDETARTVRAIAASEKPTSVFDYDRYDIVDEVLLMDGAILPASGRVPLLDSHQRRSVSNLLGSAGDFKAAKSGKYAALEAAVAFGDTGASRQALALVRDGHLTDLSVGYEPVESMWIPAGQKQNIAGREYTGPLKVTTRWLLKELSVTPIGADDLAKMRSQGGAQPMNKRLKKLLKLRHGLPVDATGAQARAMLAALPQETQDALRAEADKADPAAPPEAQRSAPPAAAPPASTVRADDGDLNARAEDAARAALARVAAEHAEIREAVRMGGLEGSFADELIAQGHRPDTARKAVLAKMADGNRPMNASRAEVVEEERDKFFRAAHDGLRLRMGVKIEKPAAGHEAFRGMSLLRMAEEFLTRHGIRPRAMDSRSIAEAALAMRSAPGAHSTDFPHLMGNVANAVLLAAYQAYPSTWEMWCATTSVNDFKQIKGVRMSEAPDLDLIGENGEYKYGTFDESAETYSIRTYGKLFALTREMLINDDMRAFARVPQAFGTAARRKIGDVVYAKLVANPTMSDGKALFHSAHNNLAASGAALGVDPMKAAKKAMRLQKDMTGNVINVEPAYLLIPAELEFAAGILLGSAVLPQLATGATYASVNIPNPFLNSMAPVVEPRLDAASSTAWYLAGRPGVIDTMEVAFLNGVTEPYLEEKEGFERDGVSYKVRFDFGAGLLDHRGLYKNAGA
jgi:hypothetical protein